MKWLRQASSGLSGVIGMTISERIFELLDKRGMSQKEFSEKTGIAQSSISDWKRKKTNPVSDKILIICNVLNVTPYELLGGTDGTGNRSNPSEFILVEKNSELGESILTFFALDKEKQGRILGYLKALSEMKWSGVSGVDRWVSRGVAALYLLTDDSWKRINSTKQNWWAGIKKSWSVILHEQSLSPESILHENSYIVNHAIKWRTIIKIMIWYSRYNR